MKCFIKSIRYFFYICKKCDTNNFSDAPGRFRHDCVNLRCSKCDEKYNPYKNTHLCFMKPLEKKEDKWPVKKDVSTFYYDGETKT